MHVKTMALHDNKHWLLSHLRNSFITSDDSGMCEAVMIDNIAKQLPVSKYDCYPSIEEDEDLDRMAQSFDLNSDLQFGLRRHRSNTAQRLEKMEQEKKKAANTIHVKWINNPHIYTQEQRNELFPRKELKKIKEQESTTKVSLLTELLKKFPDAPRNPFKEYSKWDGNAQLGVPTKKYSIFVGMLNADDRRFPMQVVIVASAKVLDLIGLICWKCSIDHPEVPLKDNVNLYGLYIAEDDGDVDWDFPCLDSREVVSKFGFNSLALVEREHARSLDDSYSVLIEPPSSDQPTGGPGTVRREMEIADEFMNTLNFAAIEAPIYQSFNVYILNKVRAKTEIHLGISGEKLEILPVLQQRVSAKIWGKLRAESFSMDDVVSCDLTENKANNRSTFRLIYYQKRESTSDESGTFKHRDFETETTTASDIVRKVNHILEVRQSERRREFQALKERKAHRKKNFHLGPR